MKRILILGGTGMLGNAVVKHFQDQDVIATYRPSSIQAAESVSSLGVDWLPFEALVDSPEDLPLNEVDVVINCMGVIKPFSLKNPAVTNYVNAVLPHLLLTKDTPVIQITTDCVFSGHSTSPYDEYAPHDASDIYGRSKSLGEPHQAMVLRTSIIGEEIHKQASLIAWAQQSRGKKVDGYTNHTWNGITTNQFAQVCRLILDNNLFEAGVFHVHSPVAVNKYDLLGMINSRFDLKLDIVPTEASVAIQRVLSSKKTLCTRLSIPDISYQIDNM